MSAQSNNPLIRDSHQRPLQDLRISVTDRCNFRCNYCMPKAAFGPGYRFLKRRELLDFDEIIRVTRLFSQLGVNKVRLTGGEPLLRQNLDSLIEQLAAIPGIDDIALTTNASLLTPQRVKDLVEAGVKRINISLDAITPAIYETINEINFPIQQVLDGIDCAIEGGFNSVKINMVVQKGINHNDILPMASYFRGRQAILRFIEFMDVGNHNHWAMDRVFSAREIVDTINEAYPLNTLEQNYQGEVAKRWQYRDGAGEIGVISSITQPFCHDCSRARLSAIGEVYTCLFASSGFDLRQRLRNDESDEEILAALQQLWQTRSDQYSVERLDALSSGKKTNRVKVEMSYIGG